MTIYWTHTVPCSECQGLHTEYANRPQCQGCESLCEHMREDQHKKAVKPEQKGNKAEQKYEKPEQKGDKSKLPQIVPAMRIKHHRVSEVAEWNILELRRRGETYGHIAKVLRLPQGTVESVVQRDRRRQDAKSVED